MGINIRFLVLTETQAATVRGETANGAALDPRLMDNKTAMGAAASPYPGWSHVPNFYVLPYAVLLDADHAMWHSYLLACPDYILDIDILFVPA